MKYLSGDGAAVLRYVTEHPGISTANLARGLGWDYNRADRNLGSLNASRQVWRYYSQRDFAPPAWYAEGATP